MDLKVDKIVKAFRKVKLVKEHALMQCANRDRMPVDINDLVAVVGELSHNFIEVNDIDYEGVFSRGMIERFQDNRVFIWVRRNQTEVEKNLVTAKELCHVLVDEPADFSADGRQTIELMVDAIHNPEKNFDEDHLQSEFVAEIAAREILYPFEFREADMLKLGEDGMLKRLAIEFDVPQHVVGAVLRPKLHGNIKKIWDIVAAG